MFSTLGFQSTYSLLLLGLLAVQAYSSQVRPENGQIPLKDENHGKKRPNVVFFLTDDQDVHLNSLAYQPLLNKYVREKGTKFERHYCTVALCCPSRVNLWTGKAAHNTNVTDVNPPYGGYPKFVSQGLHDKYLPVWLQEAGYNTYYTGKLFNAHTVKNYASPYPSGFTGSDFLLDPYTYRYLNSTWQRNQDPPKSYEGHYSTDVLASKALGFLDEATEQDEPFFLTIASNAPHSNVEFENNDFNTPDANLRVTAPISAKRHEHLFKDVKIPRTGNFNPDTPSGVNWISQLPQQNQTVVEYNDHFYRSRLRALQAVDELVERVVKVLEDKNILEDTYIVYSSDNGYHIGQHRLQPGKECGYEEDINIPLIIRGPGVPQNATSDIVTSHTDLAPTFFDLVGLEHRDDFDGKAIPLSSSELSQGSKHRNEHINIEYWGFALGEGKYGLQNLADGTVDGLYWNNTYKGLRVIGEGYNFYYSVWCNGAHELYDLIHDPYERHNLLEKDSTHVFGPYLQDASVNGVLLSKIVPRLDALLFVLKSCKSNTCVEPWKVLHPAGDVTFLKEALRPNFDSFYDKQVRVEFDRCEQGYIIDAEGPQEPLVYRHGLKWSEFT